MPSSLLLIKLVLLFGLAFWLSVIVLNNTRNFHGGVASVGMMMSMHLFDEPPIIHTPLQARRVTSLFWHRVVYVFVLTAEIMVALLLWFAALSFAAGRLGAGDLANLALAAFIGLVFVMALGGAWFVYYIKQEGAQITHFVLLCAGLASVVVVNLPAS